MNTLVVTLDAVRRDHLAQYGYERDTFPAASELAKAGGVQFDNATVNGTYTGISLPSMLTSRHRGDEAAQEGPTVASALPANVATCAIHSNTFLSSKFDRIYGFDVYEDFFGQADHEDDIPASNQAARRIFDILRPQFQRIGLFEIARRIQEYVLPPSLIHEVAVFESAKKTTDRALEFISNTTGEFCMWVHYMDSHRPYAINAESPAFAPSLERSEIIDLMAQAGVNPDSLTDEQRQLLIDLYDSAIRYTSSHVSRLFAELDRAGLWNDTAVILTADHGEEFGEHGEYFHRNRPYDELTQVPLFLRIPGETIENDIATEPRELLDIAPTVCRLHDVEPPMSFLGTDLRDATPRRPLTTGSFQDDDPVVAARWDGWKYMTTDDGPMLFDLSTDPDEREDLASAYPERCRVYHDAIPSHLLSDSDDGVPDANEVGTETRQRLEELGYLD